MFTTAPPLRSTHDSAGQTLGLARELPLFDFVGIPETIVAGDNNKTADRLVYDPAFDPPGNFANTGGELQYTCDPQRGLYLAGETHLAYFHPGAGQRFPIPGVLFQLAFVADSDIAAGGSGAVTIQRIDSGTPAPELDITAHDWHGNGIPTGTPVYVFQHNQSKRWYAIPAAPESGAKIYWGLCQANWTYVSKGSGGTYPSAGGRARVRIKQCADSVGTDPTGDDILVYLPSNAGGDPNLINGDVIAYALTENETPICVSSYMDDPIGTVKMFTGSSGQQRPGWKCMNGTQDSDITLTGEAWDMVGKFPRGECSDGQIGTTGGSEEHDHGEVTGEAGGHSHDGATGTATANILVYDPNSGVGPGESRHIKHKHTTDPNWHQIDLAGGEFTHTFLGDGDGEPGPICSSSEVDGTGEGCGYGIDLEHAVEDEGHTHSIDSIADHTHSISSANHLPPYRSLRFLERVDNSA